MSAGEPRRILIATLGVYAPFGTDLYTRDLALALLRRGFLPVVYTTLIGPLAQQLRSATIPVVDDIDAIAAPPDVIHGHHALETLTALAKFRDVPALFVCHDSITWHSVPPSSRRIRTIVAVDRNCRDRLAMEHGVPPESVRLFLNAVDLQRFRRRGPLPARPRRAVVFSNAVTETNYGASIRTACEKRGIRLDLIGAAAARPTDRPEELLRDYDLVFAKARCALEAAAVGAAVVVCDHSGLSGMLTSASLDAMRQLNFGTRTLQRPITEQTIGEEIDRYDASDAAAVCERTRASADLELLADQYADLYEELIRDPAPTPAEDDLADLARSLNRANRIMNRRSQRPVAMARLRGVLRNSRLLGGPFRLADRIRKRLGI